MQMSMMATPNLNKELLYLNKEDRLLRWLLVKHRDTKFGSEYVFDEDSKSKFNKTLQSMDVEDSDEEYGDDFTSQYSLGEEENPAHR